MRARLHRALLKLYQRLPVLGRRWVVRTIAPSYTVGAMCIIERADGAILFVRHSYRKRWGVPGGLLKRREEPHDAAVREVREEIGVDVELFGEPAIVVDPVPQRVDLVYRGRLTADDPDLAALSPEIVEARWFPADDLPELQFETTGALIALARAAAESQPGTEVA
jgi:8-oxo-dGTP pyrophosphatase MutT (NUDIX family)